MLRDRLVCGLMDESVLKSLLSVRALTLAAAVEKAKSVEAVKRDAQAMRGDPLPVSKLEESGRFASPRPSGPGEECRVCYRCGNTSHTGQDFRFREAVCHKCKKRSHLARVCRSSSSSYRSNRRPTRWVESEVTTADKRSLSPEPDDILGNVYAVGCSRVSPYKATLELEGQPVTMEVDTGAAVSIISQKTHASLFPRAPCIHLR